MSKLNKISKEVYITHRGIWKITDDIEIECYVTNNADRLMSLRGAARAMNLKGGGSTGVLRNLKAKYIQPFLSDHLQEWVNRASSNKLKKIKAENGPAIIPFQSDLFADLCNAYVDAHIAGILNDKQKVIAIRLRGIMTAFTKVGLAAIIDEITGYQLNRKRDELKELLELYVSEEFLAWVKIFPDEFFEQLFRLQRWDPFNTSDRKMPKYTGKIIINIIYKRLPENVLEALDKKTPRSKAGNKLVRLHQSLTPDVGRKHLEKHIIAVVALMKGSDSWEHFMYLLDKSYPAKNQQTIMWELLFS